MNQCFHFASMLLDRGSLNQYIYKCGLMFHYIPSNYQHPLSAQYFGHAVVCCGDVNKAIKIKGYGYETGVQHLCVFSLTDLLLLTVASGVNKGFIMNFDLATILITIYTKVICHLYIFSAGVCKETNKE